LRVHVEGDIYISGDRFGYTLEEKRVTKTGENAGKELYMAISHHGTIAGCCSGLLKKKISESTATTLKELVSQIGQFEEEIKAAVKV
jgi:hypothetical protein